VVVSNSEGYSGSRALRAVNSGISLGNALIPPTRYDGSRPTELLEDIAEFSNLFMEYVCHRRSGPIRLACSAPGCEKWDARSPYNILILQSRRAHAGWPARLTASTLALKLSQEVLSADQVVVENASRSAQEIGNKRVTHRVPHTDAFFATRHDVRGTQYGKLL